VRVWIERRGFDRRETGDQRGLRRGSAGDEQDRCGGRPDEDPDRGSHHGDGDEDRLAASGDQDDHTAGGDQDHHTAGRDDIGHQLGHEVDQCSGNADHPRDLQLRWRPTVVGVGPDRRRRSRGGRRDLRRGSTPREGYEPPFRSTRPFSTRRIQHRRPSHDGNPNAARDRDAATAFSHSPAAAPPWAPGRASVSGLSGLRLVHQSLRHSDATSEPGGNARGRNRGLACEQVDYAVNLRWTEALGELDGSLS
jgi:hypothetical protein